jgi:hypothetical protein
MLKAIRFHLKGCIEGPFARRSRFGISAGGGYFCVYWSVLPS